MSSQTNYNYESLNAQNNSTYSSNFDSLQSDFKRWSGIWQPDFIDTQKKVELMVQDLFKMEIS